MDQNFYKKVIASCALKTDFEILPADDQTEIGEKGINLSGGQKARVVLATIQMQQPHILFLDEPTNHLDIEAIDALIDAINRYEGGVIVISHDMELITKTKCILWICENGTVTEFDGDYNDYYQKIIDDLEK